MEKEVQGAPEAWLARSLLLEKDATQDRRGQKLERGAQISSFYPGKKNYEIISEHG